VKNPTVSTFISHASVIARAMAEIAAKPVQAAQRDDRDYLLHSLDSSFHSAIRVVADELKRDSQRAERRPL
jgi:hypothetical protein